ncbi:hypothetical protein L6164_002193 [Bauhinia variegata]|uniref:Uncharacterized protein n=1 Tax=Bauhinia variegata TaxID=167791 RepID=A0ACB9PX96_BAUVA|nr:hypothetical protein L6164_002193 [Bauhinia variegata]
MVKYEGLTYHGPWKVQKWRSALSKAANLSGYHFEQDGDVYEYVFIEKILKDVSTKINRIPLHDMGQKIVRQESPLDPGRRSRLWFYEDIIHVLETNKGTDKIQFMILDAGKHEYLYMGQGIEEVGAIKGD